MKPTIPLVSIVIPVYNGSNYLRDAIDSALAQTYQNTEVLVINDGSTDHGQTEAIAKSYGKRIRYYWQKNGGVATALNLGIQKMNGEWFSWLSHDDIYYPDKIQNQIVYILNHQSTKIIYTDYDLIDKDGSLIGSHSTAPMAHLNMQIRLLESYPIHGCTTLLAKDCLDRVGGFDASLPSTQDYDLWFRLSKHYMFTHLPIKSIKSRIHQEQGSQSNRYPGEADRLYQKFIRDANYEQIIDELKGKANSWMQQLAIRFKNYGYSDSARAIFQKKQTLGFGRNMFDSLIKLYLLLPDNLTQKIYGIYQNITRLIYKIFRPTP